MSTGWWVFSGALAFYIGYYGSLYLCPKTYSVPWSVQVKVFLSVAAASGLLYLLWGD